MANSLPASFYDDDSHFFVDNRHHRLTSFVLFQEGFDEILSFHVSFSKAWLFFNPSILKSFSTHFFQVFIDHTTGLRPFGFILYTFSVKLLFGFFNIQYNTITKIEVTSTLGVSRPIYGQTTSIFDF